MTIVQLFVLLIFIDILLIFVDEPLLRLALLYCNLAVRVVVVISMFTIIIQEALQCLLNSCS